jgi:hypothetical protein
MGIVLDISTRKGWGPPALAADELAELPITVAL